MKNIKRIAYVIVIVILFILSLTIYTNANKNDEKDQKQKTFSQIKYMEGKIANLFNSMNNIESRNYSVVTSEMSKATTQKSNSEDSSSSEKSKQGGQSSSSGEEGGGSSSSQGQTNTGDTSENASEEEKQNNKKFELKATNVLTKTEDINWDIVKSEVENLYTSLPSITMDLYQFNINQEDILGFNTEYDKLTRVVKDEKKEETLAELTKVYEYFPKFLRGSGQELLYTTLIETKWNVFKAYSKLDSENWQEITNDIKSAIDTYSKLLTNTEIDSKKQYTISKGYIMLNELQNAVGLNDTTVFLIKYKNLLEEMNNL
ncbi:MAG: hypothetical protein HFJ34_00885 [Clostridia bacterium]|nr:hypothetical protein [Clostridia bacterium]